MFERFTQNAKDSVRLGQEEARSLNHVRYSSEHLILGMLRVDGGVAAKALNSLHITLDSAREVVSQFDVEKGIPPARLPFAASSKKVLELSLTEALQLGHNYIGTEHILLGVVREGVGGAAQVLVKSGAELDQVRRHVIQILSGYTFPEPVDTVPVLRKLLEELNSEVVSSARLVGVCQDLTETAIATTERLQDIRDRVEKALKSQEQ